MVKKKPKRQINTNIPNQTFNPIIPTEVFLELNPELEQFIATKYPQIIPHYGNYYGYTYKNSSCYPRRFCVPYPCAPV